MSHEFNTLYIIESDSQGRIDQQLVILFDPAEDNYYVYGTRGIQINKSKNFRFVFPAYRKKNLCFLIRFLIDYFHSPLTIALHNVSIDYEDYDYVDFDYLQVQMDNTNEIVAYDETSLTSNQLRNLINVL